MIKHSGNLELTTPGDREIVMRRTFNAPRTLVFDAYTKPELVRQWLGVFGGNTMSECEIDLRVGGRYRYVWTLEDGSKMGLGGVFREIVVPERIVATEKFEEPWYGDEEAQDTITFEEKDGRTTLTITVLAPSKEAREQMLQSGMADGVTAGYDQLDEILQALQAEAKR